MNPDLELLGVIATFYNARRNLDQQIISNIDKHFPGMLFEEKIRQNTALAEAPVNGMNIFVYNDKSSGALQYKNLTNELLQREEC